MEELPLLHRCSPSFYDGMSYIEPLVRYHLVPDHENEKVIYHSYVSTLRNYWIKAKRVLISPTSQEIQIALQRRKSLLQDLTGPSRYESRYYEVQVSTDYFSMSENEYLERLRQKVPDLNVAFKKYLKRVKTGPFDKIHVMEAYYFLSLVFCLDPLLMMDNSDDLMQLSDHLLFGEITKRQPDKNEALERLYIDEMASIYPLCNDAGVFSIGGYLFAYGNGVDLFGIPSQISTFDLTTDCSTEFLVHEMNHYYQMKDIRSFYGYKYTKKEAEKIVKNEHLRILETEDFSTTDREVLLLGLWYILHEISILLSDEGSFVNLFESSDLSFLEVPLSTRIYPEFTTVIYKEKIHTILLEIQEVYPEVYSTFMERPPTEDIPVEESMAIFIFIYAYDYYSFYQGVVYNEEEEIIYSQEEEEEEEEENI